MQGSRVPLFRRAAFKVAAAAFVATAGLSVVAAQPAWAAAATVTGLSVSTGSANGGASVVVTGTNFGLQVGAKVFSYMESVQFGTALTTNFTVQSSTQITVQVPMALAGATTVDVTVTTTSGISAANPPADQFTYTYGAPTVTGVTTVGTSGGVASGPTNGGTAVTIAGTNLTGATAASFGGTAATSVLVNSSQSVTVTSPAGSGTKDLTVTTPSGTTPVNAPADQFTYNSTFGVANGFGSYTPGTTTSTGLPESPPPLGQLNAFALVTGGGGYNPSSLTVITQPAAGGGTVTPSAPVAVTAATASTASGVTTVTITSAIDVPVGQSVTISGATGGTWPSINGAQKISAVGIGTESFVVTVAPTGSYTASSATVTPPLGILTYAPAINISSTGSGSKTKWTYDITTTGTQTATVGLCPTGISPGAPSCVTATITYTPSVSAYMGGTVFAAAISNFAGVTSDTEASAVITGAPNPGSTITLTTSSPASSIPSANSGYNVLSAGQFSSITPVPAGLTYVPGSLRVSGGDSLTAGHTIASYCTAYIVNQCTAQMNPPNYLTTFPYIETFLNPVDSVAGGGTFTLPSVTAQFAIGAGVALGTVISDYQTEFVSSTTVQAPIGPAVLDAYPSSSTAATGIGQTPAYSAPPARWSITVVTAGTPAVTGVSPNSGPTAGGTSVTVSGSNFTGVIGASGVKFGSANAASYVVNNSGSITAVSPPGAAGAVDVTVTNSHGTSTTGPADQFTYIAPTTVPGAPAIGAASAADSSATVNWSPPADTGNLPITGYVVTTYQGANPIGTTDVGNQTSATVNGLTNGTTYTFTVAAVNADGTGAASGPSNAVTPAAASIVQQLFGYWTVTSNGGVFANGLVPLYGSAASLVLNSPIVGMAPTADHHGYWLVASDGGIFAYGDAGFFGSMGGTPLNAPIVGMTSTPDGHGYWLVASDGGVFAFGDAAFNGSMGGTPLNQPVVGMASAGAGGGYWLVARDGGIFSFGSAGFFGSTGGTPLHAPIVAMATAPGSGGYWLVASDGGVFAFGSAPFAGSTGGSSLPSPVVGITPGASGGYVMAAADGSILAFGTGYLGSQAGTLLTAPVVGISS